MLMKSFTALLYNFSLPQAQFYIAANPSNATYEFLKQQAPNLFLYLLSVIPLLGILYVSYP